MDEEFLHGLAEHTKYLIAGKETCPTTGRPHWQGFLYLANAKTKSAVIKMMAPRHIEIAGGSPQQNREYCLKLKTDNPNAVFIEHGEMPEQGKRNDILAATQRILAGESMTEVAEALPEVYVKFHKGLEKWRDMMHGKKRTTPPEIIVLWGDAGTGKTRDAVGHGATIVGFKGTFFDNYNYEEIVCIDEFDHATMPRSTFTRVTDRYEYRINVKGADKQWNPRVIYITSNHDPWNWYEGDNAVRRRLTRVYWYRKVGDELIIDDQTPKYDELRASLTQPSAEVSPMVAPSQ